MKLGEFIILLLGTLRLSEIINYEEIARPFREWVGIAHGNNGMTSFLGGSNQIKNFVGKAISCFSCLSVWTSLTMGLLYLFSKNVALFVGMVLGLSWLTVLTNRVKNKIL